MIVVVGELYRRHAPAIGHVLYWRGRGCIVEFWWYTPMLYDRQHNDFKRNDTRRQMIDSEAKVYENTTSKFFAYTYTEMVIMQDGFKVCTIADSATRQLHLPMA